MQDALADTFTDIRKNGLDSWSDLITRMTDMWMRMLEEMAAEALMRNLFGDLMKGGTGGNGTGLLGGFLGFLPGMFGGGGAEVSQNLLGRGSRATGGPVAAGGLYEVNENGPELLFSKGKQFLMMGDTSGYVKPQPTQSGGLTISVPITIQGGGSKQLVADLQRSIETAVEETIRRHA
jgi:hypothetical protein